MRLEPETYAEVTRIAAGYASPKRPTVTKLHADLEIALRALNGKRAGQGLPPLSLPSIKVLRKAVEALPAFTTYAARRGLSAARKRFLLVKGKVVAERPGERVEMDEWSAHIQLILERAGIWRDLGEAERRLFSGRMYVNFAEDVATRCIPRPVDRSHGDERAGARLAARRDERQVGDRRGGWSEDAVGHGLQP